MRKQENNNNNNGHGGIWWGRFRNFTICDVGGVFLEQRSSI